MQKNTRGHFDTLIHLYVRKSEALSEFFSLLPFLLSLSHTNFCLCYLPDSQPTTGERGKRGVPGAPGCYSLSLSLSLPGTVYLSFQPSFHFPTHPSTVFLGVGTNTSFLSFIRTLIHPFIHSYIDTPFLSSLIESFLIESIHEEGCEDKM